MFFARPFSMKGFAKLTQLVALIIASIVLVSASIVAGAQQPAPDVPESNAKISLGKTLVPDTVEVGDRFALIVRIAAPLRSRIEWPIIGDTTGPVVMRSPVVVSNEGEGSDGHVERAQYELSAWGTGVLPIGLGDILIHTNDEIRRVSLADVSIVVRSVLPGDTSLHVPKPARDLFLRAVPWWQRWWPAMVVVAAFALLWWFIRRRRSERRELLPPVDAYQVAVNEFARLQKMGLSQAGEGGRHVAIAVDIMRWYLDQRLGGVLSLTSVELLDHVVSDTRIHYSQLVAVLEGSDQIKFAGESVNADVAESLGGDARRVVELFEERDKANRAAEKAALLAARLEDERAEQRAKVEVEEAARKASRKPRSRVG